MQFHALLEGRFAAGFERGVDVGGAHGMFGGECHDGVAPADFLAQPLHAAFVGEAYGMGEGREALVGVVLAQQYAVFGA